MKKSAVTPLRLIALAALGLGATGAFAQSMVTARVLSAQPMWQQVPVSDCGPGHGQPSGAGAAVGAVTGGLIGSQLGKGSGHIAGAILGAVGGAFLGNAAEASQGGYYGGGCATRYENRMTGYDVSYEYGGRQYRTSMAQDPGPWLQIPAPGLAGDPYYGQGYGQGGYGGVQSYPVAPPPVAGGYPVAPAYPAPAYPAAGESAGAVVTAPYGSGYAVPPGYAQGYPQPVYAQPAPVYVRPAPVYVRPAYVAPVGVNLSIGGVFGHRGHGHGRGGWGVGVGW